MSQLTFETFAAAAKSGFRRSAGTQVAAVGGARYADASVRGEGARRPRAICVTFAVLPFTARLELKANLLAVRGRYEEQLTVAEAMLRPEPDSGEGLALKANALLKLGPPREALPVAEQLLALWDHPYAHALVAAVHYALREDDLAVREAQEATTLMSREELGNPWSGTVLLTLVAAEARRGRKRHWQTLATRSLGSRRSAK